MSTIKVGRVEVSCLFLLLCAWLLYRDSGGIAALGLLACSLHELGHYLVLLLTKNDVKQISITAFGAKMHPSKPMSYPAELLVAAAGPCVNLALAALFCGKPNGESFAGVNLALAVFNLLPTGELDGARILRCVAAWSDPDSPTSEWIWCLGFYFTVLLAVIGVLLALSFRNLTMLLMALWLLMRSRQEKTL